MAHIKEIFPNDLTGPRSYFTDIDPNDKNYNKYEAIQKLKLQLLTKDKIVVAASSLFHDIWMDIFKDSPDLIPAIEHGIIVPAIRNQFKGIADFFENKKYSETNKKFFIDHVTYFVPWDLNENTGWFKQYFIKGLKDDNSVLRKQGGITHEQANSIILQLEDLIKQEPLEFRFLQRHHIEQVANGFNNTIQEFLVNYSNLIYRLSGARAVNSEGHFPQSNLTELRLVGNEEILSDEGIFWDIYAETVFSYLGTAIRLSPERLDNLKFKDILAIRKTFFDKGFSFDYDNLIGLVKKEVNLSDPEKLILHMQEISEITIRLKEIFSERVKSELSLKDTFERENALWQVANILSLVVSPVAGLIVGVLSALKSIPEITAPMSSALTDAIKIRMEWMRRFINNRIVWSESQRKSFLDAYRELAMYGLK